MTVGVWLQNWLDLFVLDRVKPRTLEMYQRAVRSVPPWLSDRELDSINPLDVRRWLVGVAAAHPRTAQIDRVMIMRSLKLARKCGLCSLVLDDDTCPTVIHAAKKAVVLDREQVTRYLVAAAASPGAPLLLLCLCCGLRRGEALGVRWSDVDLKTGTLHVTHQRMRAAGEYVMATLKSGAGDRLLMLPPCLLKLLQQLPHGDGFVMDCTPETLRNYHKRVLAAAGIESGVTLHGLRHTFATLAAKDGQSMKQLQATLGHSQYQLTANLYAAHFEDSASRLPSLVFPAALVYNRDGGWANGA